MGIRGVVCIVVWAAIGWPGTPTVYGQAGGDAYKDLPVASRGDLEFFVDTAGFRGPSGFTRQEINVLFDAKQLQFVPDRDHYVGRMGLTVALADSSGQSLKKESWVRNVSVDNLKDIQLARAPFKDVVGFDLRPGLYRATFSIEDIYGDKQGTAEMLFRVRDFDGKSLVSSDILFVSELGPAEEAGRFVKAGLRVLPNTTRRFLVGRPLRVYFELYNLSWEALQADKNFIIGYSLVDTSGHSVREYAARRFAKPGSSCVKTDTLDTERVPGGSYYLQVEAFDRGGWEHVRVRRQVFLVSEDDFEALTQEELDQLRYYGDLRYIAREKDLKLYKSLRNWEAKMAFLKAFWKKLDPTPGTPVNERLVEHMHRMRYAEDRYSGGPGQRGSDTAKGRVYIKYGPPDDIQYNTSLAGQKPFEVWIYGRDEFIFRDRRGSGIYELVHSSYPGEIFFPDWQNEL